MVGVLTLWKLAQKINKSGTFVKYEENDLKKKKIQDISFFYYEVHNIKLLYQIAL